MTSLLINLIVFAAIASTAAYACWRVMRAVPAEEWPASSIDYAALHAHWREQVQVRDWDGLYAQVRRWQRIAMPGSTYAQTMQVARNLNDAVFRFAVPAEVMAVTDCAGSVLPHRRWSRTERVAVSLS